MNIRPMLATDADAADTLTRLAFGTFLELEDPMTMFGDADLVRSRFRAHPEWSFVAEEDGEIVGVLQLARWGSFAMLGPVAVVPSRWDAGVGQSLLAAATGLFDGWDLAAAALFTFANSTKHVSLYHRFGFWPGHLTAVMSKDQPSPGADATTIPRHGPERERLTASCRSLSDRLLPGLDLTGEIDEVLDLGIGEVVLNERRGEIVAFAICHVGAGETSSDTCYVKFAAAEPGPSGVRTVIALLSAVEEVAAAAGLAEVEVGVDTARRGMFDALRASGYRTGLLGVRMHRGAPTALSHPDAAVLDDLR
jgi:predicted N-acetyltransferase YhbS